MSQFSQLILNRIETQEGSHIQRERRILLFDETVLPKMKVTNDWMESGTGQWSGDELRALGQMPAQELGKIFARLDDPWVQMAAVAEMVMHEEDGRAVDFTKSLIATNPETEGVFRKYFGDQITDLLKGKS